MAHRLKDNKGNCCGCGERAADPCECMAACPGLEWRKRGGIAQLIGYPEYVDVSAPPRLYKRRLLSGSLVREAYDRTDVGCAGIIQCVRVRTCSGACGWDEQGVAYENGEQTITGLCAEDSVSPVCSIGEGNAGLGDQRVLERLRARIINDGGCYSSPNGVGVAVSATLSEQLDQEDTESAAVTRLLAGPGGVWGAFGPAVSTPTAFWATRGPTDTSFAYQEAEIRIGGGTMAPGAAMTLLLRFSRAPWGTTDFAAFSQQEVGFLVGSDGQAPEVRVTVPNQQGWITVLSGCGLVGGLPG